MLSISRAYDAEYLTRQVAQGAENYYLSAVSEHGEPAGIWTGRGCPELLLEIGSEVDGHTLEEMVRGFYDPRDPNFGDDQVPDELKARLGRPARTYRGAQELYKEAIAAEPEATDERRRQLWIESKRDGRQAVKGLDLTFSPTKSVTVLHAGLQVMAQQALEAGNLDEAAIYQRYSEIVWDGVMAGNAAMLETMQDVAGQSRAGYHGKEVAGRTTGRFVEASDWVVASFRQHTSRENDPQLHVHNLVLNRVKTADGVWRTLDSRAVHKARAWAGAVGERAMEEYLSAKLGVEWRSREDGNGREIVGVDQAVMDMFSSRRAQVTDAVQALVEEYRARYGKEPSARAVFSMAQFATLDTKARKLKASECPTRGEQLTAWEEQTRSAELGSLADIPGKTLGRVSREQIAEAAEAGYQVEAVLSAAVAEVASKRAVWDRSQLIAAINRHLPDGLGGLDAAQLRQLLDRLADEALAPGREDVQRLTAPPAVTPPDQLTRADGTSIYEPKHSERYATSDHLDREAGLLEAARTAGAPLVEPERADEALGVRQAAAASQEHPPPATEADAASSDRRPVLVTSGAAPAHGLSLEQATAAYGIATSGRQIDILVGPAGAGKSRTMGALARVWTDGTGRRVVGLTTAEKAARVLAGAYAESEEQPTVEAAHNIEQFFGKLARGEERVRAGDLLIIDETSMVTTEHLAKLRRLAEQAGAKVLLTGDPEQLDAPGAGGMMRHLVDEVGAYELTEVRRMAQQWERDASLGVRAGDLGALEEYDRHGRLEEGSQEEMEEAAYQGWLADYLEGRESLLIAPTNAKAAELGMKARTELVQLGRVDDQDAIEVHRDVGGQPVALRFGIGDLIQARENNHNVTDREGRWLANRDVLRIVGYTPNGGLRVERSEGTGGTLLLPPTYVQKKVEHAYAGTVHAAQGRTVDTCHSVIDEATYRQLLYVSMTRGREQNVAYVVTDRVGVADIAPAVDATSKDPGEQARDRWDVLAKVMRRKGGDPTGLEALREETDRATHLGHLGPMWVDLVREHSGRRYRDSLRGLLGDELYDRYESEDEASPLVRLLRTAELAGHDVDELLAAAVAERPLDDPDDPADSVGRVLHHRIEQRIGAAEPMLAAGWTERTPTIADPEIAQHVRALADEMDARTARLGDLAIEAPPAWAAEHLGSVPEDPIERAIWAHRAGTVAGFREQFRPDDAPETDALGPAPSKANPEARAAWMAAYAALGRPEAERDLAAASDGELWVARAQYQREATWAPPYVGEQLRTASIAHRHFEGEAARLAAAAKVATDPRERAGLEARARTQQRLAEQIGQRAEALADVDEARQRWHRATEDSRIAAQRADSELRRRLQHRGDTVDLPPLHNVEEPAAAPKTAEANARTTTVEVEQAPEVIPGQTELDITLTAETTPEQARPARTVDEDLPELVKERRQRLDWVVGQIDQDQAKPAQAREQQHTAPKRESRGATVTPEPEVAPKAISGQTELDLGLDERETRPAARRVDDPQLRTAVEQAQNARRILDERERQAAQRAQEKAAREAQSEAARVARTTAERRAAQVDHARHAAAGRPKTTAQAARVDSPQGPAPPSQRPAPPAPRPPQPRQGPKPPSL